jgi:hypothetical protein
VSGDHGLLQLSGLSISGIVLHPSLLHLVDRVLQLLKIGLEKKVFVKNLLLKDYDYADVRWMF